MVIFYKSHLLKGLQFAKKIPKQEFLHYFPLSPINIFIRPQVSLLRVREIAGRVYLDRHKKTWKLEKEMINWWEVLKVSKIPSFEADKEFQFDY